MSIPFLNRSAKRLDAAQQPRQGRSVSPLAIYLIILVAVFLLDSLETWFTPSFIPFMSNFPRQLYDPFLTTLFTAPVLWFLVFRPLHRAVRDERVYHEALKSQVVDAVVTLDMEGRIISINPAAEKIFGYDPVDIAGKKAAGLFCDDALSAPNLERYSNRNEVLIHEVTCYRKNGEALRLEISVSRLLVAETSQFLVLMRDITSRVVMEMEIKGVQSRLIQVNKMTALGMMVSGVAHEINNPNNYILSNAQMLERTCDDIIKILREYHRENGDFSLAGIPVAEMERCLPEMVTGIIDGTRRINGIINELKDFYRDGPVSCCEPVALNAAVNSAISIIRPEIVRHTHKFRFIAGEGIPIIMGNSHHIGQVVINLLMNACQSLRSQNEAVTVETLYDSARSEAVISVSDEGAGIKDEIAMLVKDSFFSTKIDKGGSGLGLSISDAIIKELKGTLTFDSVPDVGTVFYVRLPVQVSPDPEVK